MAERNVEQQIQVRQITDVHANWNEQGRGEAQQVLFTTDPGRWR